MWIVFIIKNVSLLIKINEEPQSVHISEVKKINQHLFRSDNFPCKSVYHNVSYTKLSIPKILVLEKYEG